MLSPWNRVIIIILCFRVPLIKTVNASRLKLATVTVWYVSWQSKLELFRRFLAPPPAPSLTLHVYNGKNNIFESSIRLAWCFEDAVIFNQVVYWNLNALFKFSYGNAYHVFWSNFTEASRFVRSVWNSIVVDYIRKKSYRRSVQFIWIILNI